MPTLWRSGSQRYSNMTYTEYIVPLRITADAYQRMYSGDARSVVARDRSGQTIQFPADSLRPFVTHDGISGTFVIRVDKDNRLASIRRLEAPRSFRSEERQP
jgi:hypothetical protein